MFGKINFKILGISLLSVVIVAGLGSLFTGPGVQSDWYESIKPGITPPNIVFPIAWTTLFLLIAFSLYLAWVSSAKEQKIQIMQVFGANFVLNILWSAIYFGQKNPGIAFLEIIVLWLSICVMIFTTWKINKKSAYLLVPYLLWVSFAAVLNFLSIK